ncbi:SidA/IucD/PvdA family monooxygenase [Rhizobium sp. FY34]|uniref:lysine N(6)-hydroxylase/L-ornithine N(5)-oxygenase family protein n=1 Tax=Rhizobium sp. FY34 TaxID=2562309 RepID=UPI0010BF6CEE|nr:SidA/IucD/PvdA family monooxygenase [Rhizobium sp. FY34]
MQSGKNTLYAAANSVDVLGLGCGPANLALAAAIEDGHQESTLRAIFTERADSVEWQKNMLIPWSRSQTSFVKDLVTLRNPRSEFSFLNFLKATGKLVEFANLGTLFPYRIELSAYVSWVAERLGKVEISTRHECTALQPVIEGGRVTEFEASFSNGRRIRAADVVVGIGRKPNIPTAFKDLPDDRCAHSSKFLSLVDAWKGRRGLRVAVVGSGQSAAEILLSIPEELPESRVTVIMRSLGFRNSETSKFLDEFYFPEFVDVFYGLPEAGRRLVADEIRHTNYAGVTPVMLEALYSKIYLERLTNTAQHEISGSTEVVDASVADGNVHLQLRDMMTNEVSETQCDFVVLATGYETGQPALLADIGELLIKDATGQFVVNRNYRVETEPGVEASIYLQGYSEATHGITEGVLSIVSIRAQNVLQEIFERRAERLRRSSDKMRVAN